MQPELNNQFIKTECERCFQIWIQTSFCIQLYILHCGVFTVCVERRKPHHWAASPAGTCQARSLLFFAYGAFGRMCLCGLIKWLWSRSWSQCELKLPEDLCKLHSVRGCYKLAPYSPCDEWREPRSTGPWLCVPQRLRKSIILGLLHTAQEERNGGHAPSCISLPWCAKEVTRHTL